MAGESYVEVLGRVKDFLGETEPVFNDDDFDRHVMELVEAIKR